LKRPVGVLTDLVRDEDRRCRHSSHCSALGHSAIPRHSA
jgi:hypothetical protein